MRTFIPGYFKKKLVLDSTLTGNDSIIGFCFMYNMPEYKSAWMDYFAISKTYQDIGYGTLLFNNVISNIGGGEMSLFLELEIPPNDDKSSDENKRIRFYERQGVKRLDIDYKLPIGSKATPMYIGFKPANSSTIINKELLSAVINEIMENIHAEEKNMPFVRDEMLSGIESKTNINYFGF